MATNKSGISSGVTCAEIGIHGLHLPASPNQFLGKKTRQDINTIRSRGSRNHLSSPFYRAGTWLMEGDKSTDGGLDGLAGDQDINSTHNVGRT